MKVILIGGNRLSRGLTIVDLTVSFYVRHSVNYDTLLQMGRWFGYREQHVDLTRIWTTGELSGLIPDLLEALGGEQLENAAAAPATSKEEAEAPF